MKILIVDDSAETRYLMKVILEHGGHTVAGEAADGESGVAAFKKHRPDVVLLDLIMPGMGGLAALEKIREIDPEARVIIVTAVEQDEVNRRLMLLGASGIIFKPFSAGDFDKAFRAFLPRRLPGAGNETIKRLAAGGLSRCMLKTAEASSWAWELHDVNVFPGKLEDVARVADFGRDAGAVQVNVRSGPAFAAALVFRAGDAEFIAGALVKEPLYRAADVKDLRESLLLEIGNIVLNALLNPLIDALKKGAIPSVPILVKGGPAAIAAGLGACLAPEADFRIISAALGMRREGRAARAGVVGIISEELAAELERAG